MPPAQDVADVADVSSVADVPADGSADGRAARPADGPADGPAARTADGSSDGLPVQLAAELADGLAAVRAGLAGLAVAVEEIRANLREIDEFHALRAKDRRLIEQLHTENTELHNGQLTKAMAPLFNGLISLYDLMTPVREEDRSTKLLRDQVVQILDLNGVELYQPKRGEAFDSKRQHGTRTAVTEDPGADATVARMTRVGFLRGDVVVRPALVEVYRLRKPAGSASAR